MNTISTKLEAINKNVAEKADALLKNTIAFVQDPDARSCFNLAANHGMRLDKIPDLSPDIRAMQTALNELRDAEKNEELEKAEEIKQSAPPIEVGK